MSYYYSKSNNGSMVPSVLVGGAIFLAASAITGGIGVYRRYRRDMETIRASMVEEESSSWPAKTFWSPTNGLIVQYMIRDPVAVEVNAEENNNNNKKNWCLVLHPAGGGCDQGRLLGEWLLPQDWGIVAPSRAGYLQSDWKPKKKNPQQDNSDEDDDDDDDEVLHFDEAFVEAQVTAIIELLDHLGLPEGEQPVSILGLSAGGILSLELARRYPLRFSSSLVLLSPIIPYYANDADKEEERIPNPPRWVLKLAFGSDFVKWMAVRLFPDATLQSMFGSSSSTTTTDNNNNNNNKEEEQDEEELLDKTQKLAFLETLLPARERFPGFVLDFEALRTHRLTAEQLLTTGSSTRAGAAMQCKILFLASRTDVQCKLEYNRLPAAVPVATATTSGGAGASTSFTITEIIRESGTHMLLNDIHGTKMEIEKFLLADDDDA